MESMCCVRNCTSASRCISDVQRHTKYESYLYNSKTWWNFVGMDVDVTTLDGRLGNSGGRSANGNSSVVCARSFIITPEIM